MTVMTASPALDSFLHRIDECAGASLAPEPPLCTAVAPAVIDIMGAMAEPFGVQSLTMQLAQNVTVGLQLRSDAAIEFVRLPVPNDGSPQRIRMSASVFLDSTAQVHMASTDPLWARLMGSMVQLLLRQDGFASLRNGCTLFLETPFAGDCLELGGYPIMCALVRAAANACGTGTDAASIRNWVHAAIRSHCGLAVEKSFACCASSQQPGRIRLAGAAGAAPDWMNLPAGSAVSAVACALDPTEMADNYRRARVTTLMGVRILNEALAAGGSGTLPWRGNLAEISVPDYVAHVRNRLPTKMKGSAFVERFGPINESGLTIVPEEYYKIRSRTEHPIYEQARVRQFTQHLAGACQAQRPDALVEAGDLMYASHWSYGQRCGMGSIATDALVSALRKLGLAEGIFGARISGLGSGGLVVILHKDTPATRSAIKSACDIVGGKLKQNLNIYEASRLAT